MTPFLDVSPTVGFIPTIPLIDAGPIIDVSVSVPNDRGTMFAETATAEPELEPSGIMLAVQSSMYLFTRKAGGLKVIPTFCLKYEVIMMLMPMRKSRHFKRSLVYKAFRKYYVSKTKLEN